MDICAEELHNSVTADIALQADIGPTAEGLINALKERKFSLSKLSPWWDKLATKGNKNKEIVQVNLAFSKFLL